MVASAQCVQSVTRALQLRGRTIVRVHGRSMYPALRNGVRLEVQPVVYDELRIGDLVVYHNGSGMICHRLIRKSDRLLYVKGDTNLFADPPVVWPQVLGRVIRVIDDDLHIHSLDTPSAIRQGALIARCSYIYSLCFSLLRTARRFCWWSHGVEWMPRR